MIGPGLSSNRLAAISRNITHPEHSKPKPPCNKSPTKTSYPEYFIKDMSKWGVGWEQKGSQRR